jgi:hypothetical protein
VLKLDPAGGVQWQREFGGSGAEEARAVGQTSDGGYVVAGYTGSFGVGHNDVWLVKVDWSGNIQWQWAYGGGSDDIAQAVQQTSDGGYIVAGYTSSYGAGSYDFWVVKLDSAGGFEWQKAYGGQNSDVAYSIHQTGDGGYVVAGETNSFGSVGSNVWVVKLDPLGNIENQWGYGGSGGEYAHSIRQTTDGGYIVGGTTTSYGAGSGDTWVLKLDAAGNVQWDSVLGGSGDDRIYAIQQTSDGGYVATGYRQGSDVLVLRFNPGGTVLWQHSFSGSVTEIGTGVQQTADGGYAVAGMTNSFGAGSDDVWVLRLDTAGNLGACGTVIQDSSALASNTTATAVYQCSE